MSAHAVLNDSFGAGSVSLKESIPVVRRGFLRAAGSRAATGQNRALDQKEIVALDRTLAARGKLTSITN